MDTTENQPSIRPRLGDGVIEIRRYQASFADALYEAVDESRAELGAWMFWVKSGYSPADAAETAAKMEQAWLDRSLLPYVIFDPADDRFLGGVGLSSINPIHRFANLGYWVRASCTGRGIAAQAAQLMARIGFEDFGLIRLELIISVHNDRSRRVAEKVGANFEGVLRSRLVTRAGIHDARSYSLISPKALALPEEK
jgi:ribosomal-protein-serine acetyltransferase